MSCTHQTGNNCNQPSSWWDAEFGYPHRKNNQYYYGYEQADCQNIGLPSLAPGVMGVGQPEQSVIDMDVQQCATIAKEKLYSPENGASLQDLYNQGFTDQQIWNALYTECEKQLSGTTGTKTDSQAKPLIPEKVNTYGAIGIAAGTLVIGGIIGYFIGRP